MDHILVVDDAAVERALAGKLLEGKVKCDVEYASDGVEALEHMEARLPLAIVTDLQMPNLDGIQLVEAVRQRYPMVPVILMTAHGSEDIALQALLSGAADYVPKSRLASDLLDSVESALTLMTPDRPHRQLAKCLRYEELAYELDNDTLLIPPLVQQLQHIAMDLGVVSEADGMRFAKSLVEALRNAIFHGNLELPFDHLKGAGRPQNDAVRMIRERRATPPYQDRKVHLRATFSPEQAQIVIRDEGPGFDIQSLPDVEANPMHLVGGSGRGLVLIRMFMDEVTFNPRGNEITLTKFARP